MSAQELYMVPFDNIYQGRPLLTFSTQITIISVDLNPVFILKPLKCITTL